MHSKIFYVLVLFFIGFLPENLRSQTGVIDRCFNPEDNGLRGDGTLCNDFANGSFLLPDGSLIVYGNFTKYSGLTANKIVKLFKNGDPDTSFHPKFNGSIRAGLLNENRIILGGDFTSLNGKTSGGLVVLDFYGKLDTSFHPGTGLTGTVYCIHVLKDSTIMVGGSLSKYNGSTISNLIKIKFNGSYDNKYLVSTWSLGYIEDIDTMIGGQIIIASSYSSYGKLSKLNNDGTVDTSFHTGTGFNNYIYTIQIDKNNSIYVGGNFSKYNGVNYSRLIKLKSNGSIDNSLNIASGFDNTVMRIALFKDTILDVVGNFAGFKYQQYPVWVRIGKSGSIIKNFNAEIYWNQGGSTNINYDQDSNVILTGSFNGGFIKYTPQGNIEYSKFAPYGASVHYYVCNIHKTVPTGQNKILLSGSFGHYNRTKLNGICRIFYDGKLDTTFKVGIGLQSMQPGSVNDILIDKSNKYLLVGSFSYINGVQAPTIVRLNNNGSIDNTFTSPATSYFIDQAEFQSDGKIIIFGTGLSNYDGNLVPRYARIKANGGLDNTFKPLDFFYLGFSSKIDQMKVGPNDKIYFCGESMLKTGSIYSRMIALNNNGSIDSSFNPGTGFDMEVFDMEILPDNRILVCGRFTSYNGQNAKGIIRLFPNGKIDTSFHFGPTTANGYPTRMTHDTRNGNIILYFEDGSGLSYTTVRSDSTGKIDTLFSCKSDLFGGVRSISVLQDESIIAGGSFNNIYGNRKNRIARISDKTIVIDSMNAISFCHGEKIKFKWHCNRYPSSVNVAFKVTVSYYSKNNNFEKTVLTLGKNNQGWQEFSLPDSIYGSISLHILDSNYLNCSEEVVFQKDSVLHTFGNLSGPDTLCKNASVNYQISQPDASLIYKWNLPIQWSVKNTFSDGEIQAVAGKSGNITLNVSNKCKDSFTLKKYIVVRDSISKTNSISGPGIICKKDSLLSLSVIADSNAISYRWYSSNTTVLQGQGTNKILAKMGNSSPIFCKPIGYCDSNFSTSISIKRILIDTAIRSKGDSIYVKFNTLDSIQFVDCNSFQLKQRGLKTAYKPSYTGNFRAILFEGLCTDTTFCIEFKILSTNIPAIHPFIQVYPNPAENAIRIQCTEECISAITNFEICHLNGSLIYSAAIADPKNIDISFLKEGNYILVLTDHRQKYIFPFEKI